MPYSDFKRIVCARTLSYEAGRDVLRHKAAICGVDPKLAWKMTAGTIGPHVMHFLLGANMAEDPIALQLAKARERLLDLTMRNRLLNYTPPKRQSIRIVDELPGEVWKLLLLERKKLGFLGREEHELFDGKAATEEGSPEANPESGDSATGIAETDTDDDTFALPRLDTEELRKQGTLAGRYSDTNLQTSLTGENLQTNLLRIYQAAESALQERGTNFLFLSMGFVEWKQTQTHGDRVFKAPILLVPVGLIRTSAKRRFSLVALEDEPVLNPCLVRKLQDFRIELPDIEESWEDFDVEAYLRQVGLAITDQEGWSVSDDMFLGLFSFTKYLMYVDLGDDRWSRERSLRKNPLIRALCGDGDSLDSPSDLPDAHEMDQQLNPEQVFQVLEADSSQQTAIHRAKAGQSLVIEGPPGTGKSQTITNIIAECLAEKKTVLFVSEKMAALNVVKHRLDNVGLGDFVLELHSTKANRKAVTAELSRVLEKGRIGRQPDGDGAQRLLALKLRLDAYVKALHEPFGPAGLTPYQAMGRILLLNDVRSVACNMPDCMTWTPQQIAEMKDLIQILARQLSNVWPPGEHPWRGAHLTLVTIQIQQAVTDILDRLLSATAKMLASTEIVAAALNIAASTTVKGISQQAADAEFLAESPGPDERLMTESLWDDPSNELKTLLSMLKTYSESKAAIGDRYRPESIEQVDWQSIQKRCDKFWVGMDRFFRRSYWRDRKTIKRSRLDGRFPKFGEVVADLRRLATLQQVKKDLESAQALGEKFFGSAWQGSSGSVDELIALGTWLHRFRKRVNQGRIGSSAFRLAVKGSDNTELVSESQKLREILNVWQADWGALKKATNLDEVEAFAQPIEDFSLQQLVKRLQQMHERVESLLDWSQYQEALEACNKSPIADFAAKALTGGLEPDEFVLAFDKQFLSLYMQVVLTDRPELRRFNGRNHEADQSAFGDLDRRWVEQTTFRLQAKLAADRPTNGASYAQSSQMGILSNELRRKRGGRTIRRMLLDAKDAIQKLKPCLMMSPLSVAQFLAPSGMQFDVIVFDEASQVEPADALGAIARGQQLILVGDPKQLPPTSFFAGLGGEGASGNDESAALVDMESILDKGLTVMPSTRLRWHYRSRHESLIAFSNQAFYDNDLVVFPSSHVNRDELGLSMRLESADLYDRGHSQTNREQAKRIAGLVFEHARKHPHLSLGVGAFSQRQQQIILDELERLRMGDDSIEEFFDTNKKEPFFVKNLETIQGDERDVILLSVGYGRSQPSERVSMNFGPLNQDGGWRRLNVLITRARQKCVVFSSIKGDDFDLGATAARGVHSLKGYLDYASTGRMAVNEVGRGEFGSEFERAVYNALTEKGLQLHKQVGCVGYAIDLAVVDPDNPGRYLLGIECDGATYHGSATARDRDRLRQQVLEDLGWRIHRIWSTEWFQKPQSEVQRVLEAVAKAKAGLLKPRFAKSPVNPKQVMETLDLLSGSAPSDTIIPTQAYQCFVPRRVFPSEEFYTEPAYALAEHVVQIVSVEGPIHQDELARRMASIFGMSRAGAQIVTKVAKAVEHAVRSRAVVRKDDFLWSKDVGDVPVRVRDGDCPRDISLVCQEEIGQAAWLLLKAQFGMSRQDLITQTARILGFNNTGATITAAVEAALTQQISCGRISEGETGLSACDSPATN